MTHEDQLLEQLDLHKLPCHVAIIMDGNGRWAKKRGFPRIFGHRAGIKSVREIVKTCGDLGISHLTLYAFSTENWLRPKSEVLGLMGLLEKYLRSEREELNKHHVRLQVIGNITGLPSGAQKVLKTTIDYLKNNPGLTLTLALNYGGRQEIIHAVQTILKSGVKDIDEERFSHYLFTRGMPEPDLLIRTSGETRISNFLLWQIAYSELYITPVLWPDFRRKNFLEALLDYQKRERRFGGV